MKIKSLQLQRLNQSNLLIYHPNFIIEYCTFTLFYRQIPLYDNIISFSLFEIKSHVKLNLIRHVIRIQLITFYNFYV